MFCSKSRVSNVRSNVVGRVCNCPPDVCVCVCVYTPHTCVCVNMTQKTHNNRAPSLFINIYTHHPLFTLGVQTIDATATIVVHSSGTAARPRPGTPAWHQVFQQPPEPHTRANTCCPAGQTFARLAAREPQSKYRWFYFCVLLVASSIVVIIVALALNFLFLCRHVACGMWLWDAVVPKRASNTIRK